MTNKDIRKMINSRQWYHKIEVVPGVFTPGRYDPPLLTMGFPEDFTGKTVLDIGSYDGFFAFEAERRGAKRVLAIDRHPRDHCGFAIAHELLGSKVDYMVSSVFDLSPQTHGVFDVILFLGVLYHLRHPLLAIEKIHSVCKGYVFLETHVLDNCFIVDGREVELRTLHATLLESPIMQFYPGHELNQDPSNWFSPNVRCVEQMLQTSGFRPRMVRRFGYRASFVADREEFNPPHWYDL